MSLQSPPLFGKELTNLFISLLTMEDVEALAGLGQHSMNWLKAHRDKQRATECDIAVSALVLQLLPPSHSPLVIAARLLCLGQRGINADTELAHILSFLLLLQSFLPHTHTGTRACSHSHSQMHRAQHRPLYFASHKYLSRHSQHSVAEGNTETALAHVPVIYTIQMKSATFQVSQDSNIDAI